MFIACFVNQILISQITITERRLISNLLDNKVVVNKEKFIKFGILINHFAWFPW